KIPDGISKPGKPQVAYFVNVPFFFGEVDVFMKDRFDSLVVKRGCICSGLQAINCRCNGTEHRFMDHERSIGTGSSYVRSKVCDDAYRSDVPRVVEKDLHLRGLKYIINANP